MTEADIVEVIAGVPTMGGDPLSDILAPSEMRAIAEALLASGLLSTQAVVARVYPPHLAWMAAIPAHMHDCFAS
jgi:hypothetical protein